MTNPSLKCPFFYGTTNVKGAFRLSCGGMPPTREVNKPLLRLPRYHVHLSANPFKSKLSPQLCDSEVHIVAHHIKAAPFDEPSNAKVAMRTVPPGCNVYRKVATYPRRSSISVKK